MGVPYFHRKLFRQVWAFGVGSIHSQLENASGLERSGNTRLDASLRTCGVCLLPTRRISGSKHNGEA